MRLFRKNVMRLALRNKGAVFGSILIIGIGIFILVSMLDTLRNLDGQLAAFYEKQHMADIFAEVEGIPEEEQNRIFERFYKVDKSRGLDAKSFGIGLSIAKSIVELHKGDICINSFEDDYTEFVVTLPTEA